jgi:short-subunit dehydrogenase
MKDLQNKWAMVTGASSGLGIDFCHLLAERGANVVLVARRAAEMEKVAAELRQKHGVKTHVEPVDLEQPGVAVELKGKLDAAGIAVDLLVNNAGYGLYGDFLDQPLERTRHMLQLDVISLTDLTHVFASDMVKRGGGQILLVASIGGFQATPTYAAYCAAKAYVLMLGEALHEEFKPRGVTVTTLSPGVTRTGFFDAAGQTPNAFQRAAMMESRPVAEIGLKALKKGRASIVPGFMNALTVFITSRLVPRWLQPRMTHAVMKQQ